jgi:mitochondrial import inner membrane translocase subunit TIM44
MLVPKWLPAAGRLQHVAQFRAFASSQAAAQYGRTAAYRRIALGAPSRNAPPSSIHNSALTIPQNPSSLSWALRNQLSLRPLHTTSARQQQAQPKEDVKDPPREEKTSEPKEGEPAAASEASGKEDPAGGDGKKEDAKSEKKKEEAAPPPPHGDKTPWQVFRETLSSEFKASKEWNESTKQLGSSVNQFTESEGVRRAREAQQAATSTAAKAIRGTAKAVGSGAAWTWETSAVQGVRKGINATGRGIEKATRPVRETQAFQNIKEAVDDGSSTRYGGWIEKEERKRKRELREAKEGARRPIEKMEEDPKYVDRLLNFSHMMLTSAVRVRILHFTRILLSRSSGASSRTTRNSCRTYSP